VKTWILLIGNLTNLKKKTQKNKQKDCQVQKH